MISSASALSFEKYQEREIIAAWFQLAHERGMAAALWRLPSQTHWHLVLDSSGGKMVGRVDLEETIGGFVVAPFNNPDRSKEVFLKADLYFDLRDRRLVPGSNLDNGLIEKSLVRLEAILNRGFKQPAFYFNQNISNNTAREDYLQMVQRGINCIRENIFEKVVPAVSRKVPLNTGFSCLDTFEQLSDNYPFAFVSLVTTPDLGTWMGASPESIIEIDENNESSLESIVCSFNNASSF